MKRVKSEPSSGRRCKLSHLLLVMGAFYLLFLAFKFPLFLEIVALLNGEDGNGGVGGSMLDVGEELDLSKPLFGSVYKNTLHRKLEDNQNEDAPVMPSKVPLEEAKGVVKPIRPLKHQYGRITGEIMRTRNSTIDLSLFEKMADEAWTLGLKAWEDVGKFDGKDIEHSSVFEGAPEACPSWVSMTGEELARGDKMMFLPCGLIAGSSITVVGMPHYAHQEYVPQLARLRKGNGYVSISQFMIELQGLKAVEGEAAPKILHLNPRLKGDWSQVSVIEHNICYRMQWGTAQRCDGMPSRREEDMLGTSRK